MLGGGAESQPGKLDGAKCEVLFFFWGSGLASGPSIPILKDVKAHPLIASPLDQRDLAVALRTKGSLLIRPGLLFPECQRC